MNSPFFVLINIIAAALNSLTGQIFHLPERTTVDIIKEAFYPDETHIVQTEDNYILTLHRIPHCRNNSVAPKGPILLMHGLLQSSADWLVLGEKSLGFILADAGYDVWLGNSRGNTYSKAHVNLNPLLDAKSFFDFSYHEMGKYDLPAVIDYILNATGTSKIPYVGYSEGTTQFWVMMSERPEYNDKISQANFWAPVTNMYRITSIPINALAAMGGIETLARAIGKYELFSHFTTGNSIRVICQNADWLCTEFFNLIGSSLERMPNKALKTKILENFPAGISFKQLFHYVQGTRSGVFRPFDYGTEKNLEIYKKPMPDPYNISRTTIPVFMYYGGSDIYINNEILINEVANEMQHVTVDLIPYENFNHLDFMYSTNADWLSSKTLENLNLA